MISGSHPKSWGPGRRRAGRPQLRACQGDLRMRGWRDGLERPGPDSERYVAAAGVAALVAALLLLQPEDVGQGASVR